MTNQRVHFLNVADGDCSIVQHGSGRVSVIDVNNAKPIDPAERFAEAFRKLIAEELRGVPGNFNQKAYPVNPIEYMNSRGISDVWRFILTHPDMDHMGGIKAFFETFPPTVFWDTDNHEDKDFEEGGPYNEDDWKFYKALRDSNPSSNPQRLALYSGDQGQYWSRDGEGKPGGDGIQILAPTPELVQQANETGDYNDCSYVLLYWSAAGKTVFGGDSHDKTWDHILDVHESLVTDVDLLIAPHHGRKSDRKYDFLDVLNPKLTFFGNARSEHLAYSAWQYRGLPYITNNQANCMVVDAGDEQMPLFVTNRTFAEKVNPSTFWSDEYQGWYTQGIKSWSESGAASQAIR